MVDPKNEISLTKALIPICVLISLLAYNIIVYEDKDWFGENTYQIILLLGASIASIMGLIDRVTILHILKKIDYRLVKISKNKSSFDILLDLSNKYNIETVLDVGANTGQFANTLRKNGFKNKIISFEPNSKVYDHLLKNSQQDKNWQIFKQCALGDFDGKIDLNISSYSRSTSILNFTNAHKVAKPEAKMVDIEKVNIL